MPTHIDMGVQLLREAAVFFRKLGEGNPSLKEQMDNNAGVYEDVANLLENDPNGEVEIPEE